MVKHNITFEDSSPLITYTGIWSDSDPSNPDYGNYSGYASPTYSTFHATTNGSFDFPFNGSSIYIYGTKSSRGGPFRASIMQQSDGKGNQIPINGNRGIEANSSNPVKVFHSLLYSYEGLVAIPSSSPNLRVPLAYDLHIEVEGKGDFILDYIIVESDVGDVTNNSASSNPVSSEVRTFTFDDTSSAFSYPTGTWTDAKADWATDYLVNGSWKESVDAGGQARIDFRGSGIEVHGLWSFGAFLAQLDDFAPQYIRDSVPSSQSGQVVRPRELLCAFDGLEEGNHVLLLTNMARIPGQLPDLGIDYANVTTSDPTNLDGIITSPSPASTSNSCGTTAAQPDSKISARSGSHAGTIAASVIGGAVFLVLTVLLFYHCLGWIRRRERSMGKVGEGVNTPSDASLQPHTYNSLSQPNPEGLSARSLKSRTPFSSTGPAVIIGQMVSSNTGTEPTDNIRGHPQSDVLHAPAATREVVPLIPPPPSTPPSIGARLLRWRSLPQQHSRTLPPRYNPAWTTVVANVVPSTSDEHMET